MHINECNWILEKLSRVESVDISPILDLGGSTLKYRTVDQPWLDKLFYSKLKELNLDIFFSDIKDDLGVDIVGDIFDDDVFQKIKEQNFKCIFCCNFLEHVTNPGDLIVRCMQLIPVGGYIVFTVPYSYPYHRDPIDTMFRPAPDELASLIPSHKVIGSEIINTGSYRDHLAKSPWKIFRHIRIFFPFFGFEKWKRSLIKLKWLYFNFKHTCLIVQKK